MPGINHSRIVRAGLVAGVVLIIVHGVGEAAFAAEYQLLFDRIGGTQPSAAAMLLLVAGALALGVAMSWFYALAAAVYGTGLNAGLAVAAGVWLLACLAPNLGLLAYGVLSPRFFLIAATADLIAVPLALLAGARAYAGSPRAAPLAGVVRGSG